MQEKSVSEMARLHESGLNWESQGGAEAQERAFLAFGEAARGGHLPSMMRVAVCYEYGRGTARDLCRAAEWYEAAARLGHPEAMRRLAQFQLEGVGGAWNPGAAVGWLRQAESLGSSSDGASEYRLGEALLYGLGGEADATAALAAFQRSAELGYARAWTRLGRAALYGLGMPCAPEEAALFYAKAARLGDPEAYYCLGMMYRHGCGVGRDAALADEWLVRAWRAGWG